MKKLCEDLMIPNDNSFNDQFYGSTKCKAVSTYSHQTLNVALTIMRYPRNITVTTPYRKNALSCRKRRAWEKNVQHLNASTINHAPLRRRTFRMLMDIFPTSQTIQITTLKKNLILIEAVSSKVFNSSEPT